MTITIPEGANWECMLCGETGDSFETTFREHYEEQHGGFS